MTFWLVNQKGALPSIPLCILQILQDFLSKFTARSNIISVNKTARTFPLTVQKLSAQKFNQCYKALDPGHLSLIAPKLPAKLNQYHNPLGCWEQAFFPYIDCYNPSGSPRLKILSPNLVFFSSLFSNFYRDSKFKLTFNYLNQTTPWIPWPLGTNKVTEKIRIEMRPVGKSVWKPIPRLYAKRLILAPSVMSFKQSYLHHLFNTNSKDNKGGHYPTLYTPD